MSSFAVPLKKGIDRIKEAGLKQEKLFRKETFPFWQTAASFRHFSHYMTDIFI
jgi:hypothetical protein